MEVERIISENQGLSIDKNNFEYSLQTDNGILFIYYKPSNEHCIAVVPKFTQAAPHFLESITKIKTPMSDKKLIELSESQRVRRVLTLEKKDTTVTYFGPLVIDDIINWTIRQVDPTNEPPSPPLKTIDSQEISIVDFSNNVFFTILSTNYQHKILKIPDQNEFFNDYQFEDETLLLFKKFNKKQSVFEGQMDINKLENFIKKYSLPLIIDYNRKYHDNIFKCGFKNYLYITLNRNAKVDFNKLVDDIKECAKFFKNTIMFVLSDIHNDNDMKFLASVLGMKKDDPPNEIQTLNNTIQSSEILNDYNHDVDEDYDDAADVNYNFDDKENSYMMQCYPDQYLSRPDIKKLAEYFDESKNIGTIKLNPNSYCGENGIANNSSHVLLYNKVTNKVFGYIDENKINSLVNYVDSNRRISIKKLNSIWHSIGNYLCLNNDTKNYYNPEDVLTQYGSQLLNLNYDDSLKILSLIEKYCCNLRKLTIQMDIFPTNDLISALSRMEKLEIIEICKISQNKNHIFLNFLNQLPENIKNIQIISSVFPKIKKLKFNNNYVFRRFNHLQILKMEFFEFHENVMKEIGKLKSLVNLNLNYCVIKSGIYFIDNLENIKYLSLMHVDKVDDDFLLSIVNNCKNIIKLNLSFCKSISHFGFNELLRLNNLKYLKLMGTCVRDIEIGKFKNLHKLFCHGCYNISDIGILKMVQNSPCLERLGLLETNVTFNIVEFLNSYTSNRTNNIILHIKVDEVATYGIIGNKPIEITSPFLKMSTSSSNI